MSNILKNHWSDEFNFPKKVAMRKQLKIHIAGNLARYPWRDSETANQSGFSLLISRHDEEYKC